MTFEEALNNVDAKIEYLGGVAAIVPYIPFTVEEILEKVSKGILVYENDNDPKWFRAAGFEHYSAVVRISSNEWEPVHVKENTIWDLYAEKDITSISLVDSVAIVKRAAYKYASLSDAERKQMQNEVKKCYDVKGELSGTVVETVRACNVDEVKRCIAEMFSDIKQAVVKADNYAGALVNVTFKFIDVQLQDNNGE